jgi:hypothetical protein
VVVSMRHPIHQSPIRQPCGSPPLICLALVSLPSVAISTDVLASRYDVYRNPHEGFVGGRL